MSGFAHVWFIARAEGSGSQELQRADASVAGSEQLQPHVGCLMRLHST